MLLSKRTKPGRGVYKEYVGNMWGICGKICGEYLGGCANVVNWKIWVKGKYGWDMLEMCDRICWKYVQMLEMHDILKTLQN